MQGDLPAPPTPPDAQPRTAVEGAPTTNASAVPPASSTRPSRELLLGGLALVMFGLVVGIFVGWFFAGRLVRYEYREVIIDFTIVAFVNGESQKANNKEIPVQEYLERAGAEGWELVAAVPKPHEFNRPAQILYFKRIKR